MNFLDDIKKETLVICSESDKKRILMRNKLINVKVMTMKEFLSKFCFDYDETAILYVMSKYNIKYGVALMYLENLYYVLDKEYGVNKLDFLVKLKRELNDLGLLIYNNCFVKYLECIDVIIYGIRLNKFEIDLFSNVNYKIINKERKKYAHKIYSFQTMESEIEYVASEICKLIDNGVNISNIKLTNVDSSYYNTINRIFSLFGLKLDITNKISLASFDYIKEFIKIYENNTLEDAISKIDNKHELYPELISLLNKYIKYNSRELIIYKLENTYINSIKYDNMISVVDYLDYTANDNDYIFMIGFNDGIIPSSYKDNEYITDNIKEYVGLDTCNEKNKNLREDILLFVSDVKNLVITYKLRDIKKTYYPSTLCSFFEVISKNVDNQVSYSEIYSKIKLTRNIDEYIKYGSKSEEFSLLYNNFKVKYNSYDNSYKLINRVMDKLTLSYSKMQLYNKCAFRYYLSEILKVDAFEENFAAVIGSMVHYVLEKCLSNKNKDVFKYVDEYFVGREFTNKEKFFLEKYKASIIEVLNQIDLENTYNSFDNAMYEKEIVIDYGNNIKFKGYIDKILYKDDGINTYVSLIDYKTGNDDISLKYLHYGINMQLPIYLYLSNYLNLRNVLYSGFYLQKLNIEEKDYRLEGYSNSDKDILSIMDSNYDNSKIIKGLKTIKSGEFYRFSKVLSNEEIDRIKMIVEKKILEVISNIKNNKFDINPKIDSGANVGCEFCKFSDICFVKKKDVAVMEPDLVGVI